jgi:hypothetical protein
MKYIIFFIGLLLLIPLVSSQPPQQTTTLIERGIDIIYPYPSYVKLGEDLEINFWTYNSTTGETLTNTTVNCTYYLIDAQGNNSLRLSSQSGASGRILYGKGAPLCLNCWTATIKGGNFTMPQIYSFQIKCQGVGVGGYDIGGFETTRTGYEVISSGGSSIYLSGFVMIILLSIFFFVIGINIKGILKIILIGTSFIFLLIGVLFTITTINAYIPVNEVVDGYATFWFVVKIIISIMIISLILYALVLSYFIWMDRRGLR